MQDYNEIPKRFLAGESQRHIAKTMGISRNTVKEIQSHGNWPGNAALLAAESGCLQLFERNLRNLFLLHKISTGS